MPQTFSDRHGYSTAPEITVREDAPKGLREAIPLIADNLDMGRKTIHNIVCEVLLRERSLVNLDDFEGWRTTKQRINNCPWVKVYDIAEALYAGFADQYEFMCVGTKPEEFADRLNRYFREEGIGWEMRDGQIVYRGVRGLR